MCDVGAVVSVVKGSRKRRYDELSSRNAVFAEALGGDKDEIEIGNVIGEGIEVEDSCFGEMEMGDCECIDKSE